MFPLKHPLKTPSIPYGIGWESVDINNLTKEELDEFVAKLIIQETADKSMRAREEGVLAFL